MRSFCIHTVVMDLERRAEPRAILIESKGSMVVGAYVVVEIGAKWGTQNGRTVRVPGKWRKCRIVKHEAGVIHVTMAPKAVKAQSHCT